MLMLLVAAASCRTADRAAGSVDPSPIVRSLVTTTEAAEIAALPDGAGKTLVAERCLTCHGAGLITAQRKDAAAWGRTVTQMRTWGTPIQDDDQAALIAYLSQHFRPAKAQ
jgi:cytochrome c5